MPFKFRSQVKTHPERSAACPLAAVDKRLSDAHRLWHQAERDYFDPDGFRLAAQNTIQTLRTVTFILQKNKRVISAFDDWYGPWQERLSADKLMRWMVDARNKIEKQGDLETHSFVRAEIVASYLDEGPRIEVQAHLFQNPAALLRGIPISLLRQHILRNGVLRIERRWIENTLPEYELLDALAIAFGKLSAIVHDAHRHIGLDPPKTIHGEFGETYDLPAMSWKFPCMVGHDQMRTLSISLADGSRITFEQKHVTKDFTPTEAETLLARYGQSPVEIMGRHYHSYADLAAEYFNLARSMFMRDGYHVSILFFFRQQKPVRIMQLRTENAQQKYLLMRELAHEVVKAGADAAIIIGEVWIASAESLKPYERPANSPERREALTLSLVTKDGEPLEFMAMIERSGQKALLGETRKADNVAPFEFAPFYQAWGRTVPDLWIALSKPIPQGES